MATTADFKRFCEAELAPSLTVLDVRRRKIMWIAVGCGGALAVFVSLMVFTPTGASMPLIPLSFVTALILGIVGTLKWWGFRHDYKEEVLAQIVKYVDPGLKYRAQGKVDRNKFEAGKLFKHSIDRYSGEDHVRGTLGVTEFEFSELHVEYESRSTNSDGKDTSRWKTIFKGLYFVADFHKHFQSDVVVLPDRLERTLGFIGKALQSMNPTRDDLIRLEDPEFEREFVVYGTDQIEARYILTPGMMQRMLELKRKVDGPTHFAFTGSEVHVAVSISKNHFEPKLFTSCLEFDDLCAYVDDLRLVTGIVEDLNLNTRIWSKAPELPPASGPEKVGVG